VLDSNHHNNPYQFRNQSVGICENNLNKEAAKWEWPYGTAAGNDNVARTYVRAIAHNVQIRVIEKIESLHANV
jgi:hypothetical protein